MEKEEVKNKKRILSGMKNKQDRYTVGKIALDLKSEYKADDVAPVSDIGNNSTRSTMDEIWIAVDRGKQEHKDPFFVVVLKRKERTLTNVIRQQFMYRKSCPTPTYLQSVFRYIPKDDELEYLWSLPTKQRCMNMYMNKELVPPEEYQLLRFVMDYFEGNLDRMAQTYNNESILDPLSIVF